MSAALLDSLAFVVVVVVASALSAVWLLRHRTRVANLLRRYYHRRQMKKKEKEKRDGRLLAAASDSAQSYRSGRRVGDGQPVVLFIDLRPSRSRSRSLSAAGFPSHQKAKMPKSGHPTHRRQTKRWRLAVREESRRGRTQTEKNVSLHLLLLLCLRNYSSSFSFIYELAV